MASKADLRLIDEVAPNDDPIWALRRLSCRRDTLCNREAQDLIALATANIDIGQRRQQIGEAEAVLVRYAPFIPIATPLRWSVASQRLTGLRANGRAQHPLNRSEEHTSELQSLMRISYAVFCLKQKKTKIQP